MSSTGFGYDKKFVVSNESIFKGASAKLSVNVPCSAALLHT